MSHYITSSIICKRLFTPFVRPLIFPVLRRRVLALSQRPFKEKAQPQGCCHRQRWHSDPSDAGVGNRSMKPSIKEARGAVGCPHCQQRKATRKGKRLGDDRRKACDTEFAVRRFVARNNFARGAKHVIRSLLCADTCFRMPPHSIRKHVIRSLLCADTANDTAAGHRLWPEVIPRLRFENHQRVITPNQIAAPQPINPS